VSGDRGWRLWWEFNREHLIGLRHLLHGKAVVTGAAVPVRGPDPLGERRGAVLEALRRIARSHSSPKLRASALIALGRMGEDSDAALFLHLTREDKQPNDVREAAALAVGMLPPFEDDARRRVARENLTHCLKVLGTLPRRTGELAIVSMGLRARHDKLLSMHLVERTVSGASDSQQAAVFAFACGLSGERMVFPELQRAARRSRFGNVQLNDVERSHVTLALARLGDPTAAETLLLMVRSRRAGLQTRRAAVLALGRLLREGGLPKTTTQHAGKALVKTFQTSNDLATRGFAALAAGGAATPFGTQTFMDAIDHGGNSSVKPYAALALGLSAYRRDTDLARRIGIFLGNELGKAREPELASALSIALGLSRAPRAEKLLLERVEITKLPAPVRGAAAEGLGLLRQASPATHQALVATLRSGPSELIGDVALALGMLGQRTTAPILVGMLAGQRSSTHEGRIMLALGHLGHVAGVEPLLNVLQDDKKRTLVREFAAVALGLLGDPRQRDVLFDIDADFNYLATTDTTYELLRLY
jgi:HEAT repeat protein